MREYSIYVMGPDGIVIERINLSCANDAEALDQAEKLSSGRRLLQLWQGIRFIATFLPQPTIQ
jgi:hypothetical protein